ncbi:MAG: peptidase T [Lachnospiraceae bacterium]|nr:peptidase T [Lachnospiraceae bacterium]
MTLIDRFLKYVSIDTCSDEESDTSPSTAKQHALAEVLAAQLQDMGAEDVFYDTEHCYVYATIPAAKGCENSPVIGFIAHMDTSPAMSGANVKPRIVREYDGKDIVLNAQENIVLKVSDFPEVIKYIGQDLIVTDGTTLLGADDKAGIAEIMTMAEYFLTHPEARHGKIRIGFTPDEEIGRGPDHFDVKLFGADFAYTVDGGALGELEFENFNAAGAKVTIHGRNVHPGSAKGKMKNSILIAQEFQGMLPIFENPMYTEMYEGFFHLDSIAGNVEETKMDYIIRDHDMDKFQAKKARFQATADFLNEKYGEGTIEVDMGDSYYNMRKVIEPHMHLIEKVKEAMNELGIEPIITPIRGGTDGARLSFMGLPCPNICTGGENFHGKYEYACVQSMEKIVELLIKVAEGYAL